MVTDVQGVEVARLRAKDARAFCVLIERLQQPIIRYLHRLVGERDVALDLAQDTFLQVYKEIDKTSVDLSLDAWIYRIATNYGLQYLKRKRLLQFIPFSFGMTTREDETEVGEDSFTQLAAPGLSVEEQTEMHLLLQQALSHLNPRDAACLQLHYDYGFTYEQIARIVDTTPEAVRKRVARGVSKFRAVYGKVAQPSLSTVAAVDTARSLGKR